MTICNCKGWIAYYYDKETKTIKGTGNYYHADKCERVNNVIDE